MVRTAVFGLALTVLRVVCYHLTGEGLAFVGRVEAGMISSTSAVFLSMRDLARAGACEPARVRGAVIPRARGAVAWGGAEFHGRRAQA